MNQILFTPNLLSISKTDITKDNIEKTLRIGFYPTKETITKTLNLVSQKLKINSDDSDLNLGDVTLLTITPNQISFDKKTFGIIEFLDLLKKKVIRITFNLD